MLSTKPWLEDDLLCIFGTSVVVYYINAHKRLLLPVLSNLVQIVESMVGELFKSQREHDHCDTESGEYSRREDVVRPALAHLLSK